MSEKKNILITGATGGIGEATARYLVEQGYFVVLVGRNQEKLDSLVKELSPNALAFSYDLKDLYNIESIFTFIADNNIKLDGMVHAAGINRDIAIRMNDVNVMQEVTAVNYMSFVELMKFFMRKKYSNDGGSVVAISSNAIRKISSAMCTYSASKSALETASEVAACEGIRRRIRVNSILPAGVETDMLKQSAVDLDDVRRYQPLGLIPAIDIAKLVLFLLSNDSKYITGAAIPITAGNI